MKAFWCSHPPLAQAAIITIDTVAVGDAGSPDQWPLTLNAVAACRHSRAVSEFWMKNNVRETGSAPMALCARVRRGATYSTSSDSPVHNFWSAVRFARLDEQWAGVPGPSESGGGAYDLTDSDAITNNTVTRDSL